MEGEKKETANKHAKNTFFRNGILLLIKSEVMGGFYVH